MFYPINNKNSFPYSTYLMYTPYVLLYVYLYNKFNPKGLYLAAYIVGWSLLFVAFEWIAVILHVFTYNNWIIFILSPFT
ncbi:hypothetical protein O9H85_28230 [Paenibacillus filicis]|uniref:Uncharacterized protein n=1 Tax=Paenibacillus gyeongsangnamensis TaxID=3388067 RepID=A0ABT4QH60_9BACL|nr:hypothetical protein [Paenibacillus filicis]MCZ8516213.1 hypothetical protein [Paenibacillus filicis]